MNIAINALFLKAGQVAGIETYLRGMLKGLVSLPKGDHAYYLFISKSYVDSFSSFPNLNIVSCPNFRNNRFKRIVWEQTKLASYVRNYDIDLLHSPGYSGPFYMPIPSVVTIPDLNYIFIPENFSRTERLLRRFLITTSARSTDAIITISENSKQDIVHMLGVPADRVWVTHLSARMRQEQAQPIDRMSLLAKYKITKPYILSVASSHPHKNLATLIKAFDFLYNTDLGSGYQLVLVGHQMGQHNMLQELAGRCVAGENIIFTGFVPDEDLSGLYCYADLFVFPSLYEGFGIPVLEAMKFQVPVISSNSASLPEVVGDAAITVDATSVNLLAQAIESVLSNSDLANELARRGTDNIKRFSWEKTARQTLDIYEKIM